MPGRTAIVASSVVLLITPGPTTPNTFTSSLAKYFTPTPGTAPVRNALKMLADMYARGAPVSLSLRVSMSTERGSPFSLLSTLEPYHFIPTMSNFPPRYAGIAM